MTKDPQNKLDESLNELKIGIIGVSLRGRMLAEEAVNASPGVRIGSAADTNSDLLAEFSRKYGCFQTADYRELLDRPEIHGVIMGDGTRVRGFRGTDLAFHGRLPRKVWGHAPAIDKFTEL